LIYCSIYEPGDKTREAQKRRRGRGRGERAPEIEPLRTVPVRTVPWPLMGKQWSNSNRRGPSPLRCGCATLCDKVVT
jgi:hypothetical protein